MDLQCYMYVVRKLVLKYVAYLCARLVIILGRLYH